jgi:hypothetical protein
MSEKINDEDKLKVNFIDKPDGAIPAIQLVLNIEVNDSLLMFHICHMYRNALMCHEHEGRPMEELEQEITLYNVMQSVQVSINERIRTGTDNYINEHYVYIKNNQVWFDRCLDIFLHIKYEFQELMKEYNSRMQIMQ